mmetsp:Transcript_53358/g.64272  ORF Transcript_53358/g.64272 Transcript_53358/m.64272 type:complete len:127 (+) Transcript_53358:215-595(+)
MTFNRLIHACVNATFLELFYAILMYCNTKNCSHLCCFLMRCVLKCLRYVLKPFYGFYDFVFCLILYYEMLFNSKIEKSRKAFQTCIELSFNSVENHRTPQQCPPQLRSHHNRCLYTKCLLAGCYYY